MIHTYLGGKRTDLEGNEIASDFELTKTLCTNAPWPGNGWRITGLNLAIELILLLGPCGRGPITWWEWAMPILKVSPKRRRIKMWK